MIKLLLAITVFVLGAVGYYLAKHKESFSKVLGEGADPKAIQQTFSAFSNTCYLLGIIGLPLIFLASKTIALTYIAIVMIASAFFSIKLSKKLS